MICIIKGFFKSNTNKKRQAIIQWIQMTKTDNFLVSKKILKKLMPLLESSLNSLLHNND